MCACHRRLASQRPKLVRDAVLQLGILAGDSSPTANSSADGANPRAPAGTVKALLMRLCEHEAYPPLTLSEPEVELLCKPFESAAGTVDLRALVTTMLSGHFHRAAYMSRSMSHRGSVLVDGDSGDGTPARHGKIVSNESSVLRGVSVRYSAADRRAAMVRLLPLTYERRTRPSPRVASQMRSAHPHPHPHPPMPTRAWKH